MRLTHVIAHAARGGEVVSLTTHVTSLYLRSFISVSQITAIPESLSIALGNSSTFNLWGNPVCDDPSHRSRRYCTTTRAWGTHDETVYETVFRNKTGQ
jgi:hypothetical protein